MGDSFEEIDGMSANTPKYQKEAAVGSNHMNRYDSKASRFKPEEIAERTSAERRRISAKEYAA